MQHAELRELRVDARGGRSAELREEKRFAGGVEHREDVDDGAFGQRRHREGEVGRAVEIDVEADGERLGRQVDRARRRTVAQVLGDRRRRAGGGNLEDVDRAHAVGGVHHAHAHVVGGKAAGVVLERVELQLRELAEREDGVIATRFELQVIERDDRLRRRRAGRGHLHVDFSGRRIHRGRA